MNLTEEQRVELNAKLDILFEQIDSLVDNEDAFLRAHSYLGAWQSAKTLAAFGGMPMQCSSLYKRAYAGLSEMGLDVSGMLPPVEFIE